MLINLINIILSVLVITLIAVLNIILTKEAIERDLSFKEIIEENQDTKFGFALMSVLSLPTLLVLKLWSLKPIKTAPTEDWE